MIITIDGPAGAGKSTVARQLASMLAAVFGKPFEYLDTGSMYRSAALIGLRHHVDWLQPAQLEKLTAAAAIEIRDGRTFLNGEDVTDKVRSQAVTEKIHFAADNFVIRNIMVERQRAVAEQFLQSSKGLVSEGRDQGTVVFPNTPYKFFVTASPEERTRRRLGEMTKLGETGEFAAVLKSINDRDERDSMRAVAPLCEPKDSYRVLTDGMSIDDVVTALVKRITM